MRQYAADIREYEQTKISPEVTAQTLSAIAEGIAARQEAELVEGLREILEKLLESSMKLQRWEFVPNAMGGEMRQMEDGDYCEASDVEPLEDIAKLILISPSTGHRLEVQSDPRTEGPFAVFQVGNRRESFEVRISMEEV
jgi:hypothetical protein